MNKFIPYEALSRAVAGDIQGTITQVSELSELKAEQVIAIGELLASAYYSGFVDALEVEGELNGPGELMEAYSSGFNDARRRQ